MESLPTDSTELDLNPLLRLKETLDAAQKNTLKLLGKLDVFEDRLGDLEDKMRPLQETTQRYSKAKENIALTLIEVGKTYEYFRIANDMKAIIQSGYNVKAQNEYLQALSKLVNAKSFFETHREIKSSQSMLTSIESLLTTANESCLSEFEKLLNSAEKSLIYENEQYQVILPITQETLKNILALCETFQLNKFTGHYKIYQTNRTTKLKIELKDLETSKVALWNSMLSDDPYLCGSHPFREYFLRSFWLLRSELQLWGNILPSSESTCQIFVNICESLISELQRALAPYVGEDSLTSVNNRDSRAFATGSSTGNQIVKQSKLLLIRLDTFDIFFAHFEEFLEVCRPDLNKESNAAVINIRRMRQLLLISPLRSIEYLLSSSMNEAFNSIASESNSSKILKSKLASSGQSFSCDLHPTTGNIIYCCKELSQGYHAIYRKLIDISSEANLHMKISVHLPTELEELVYQLLENLYTALEMKAETFVESTNAAGVKVSKISAIVRHLTIKSHALYAQEDKSSVDMVLAARKHLFLANNLFLMTNSLKEKVKEKMAEEAADANKVHQIRNLSEI